MVKREYWTTKDIAREAIRRGRSVSLRYLQELCQDGRIEAIRPARDYLIPADAAQAWLDQWEDPPENFDKSE